ncbi:MAG: hypothetical protein GY810_14370 [Aureispira sp.]|nr:hypothetical protein [Aureispira sp.]
MEVTSTDLLQELHKFTRRLSEVIEHDFLSLSDRQIQWQETPETWSIAHCLHHINMASAYYYPNINQGIKQAKAAGQKPRPTFKSGWFGQKLIENIQLDSNHQPKRKLRVPSTFSPIDQPAPNNSAQALVTTYLNDNKFFMQLLEEAQTVNIKKTRVAIAILKFIKLRLGDILQFTLYHNERHIVQLLRIRYHPKFPKS